MPLRLDVKRMLLARSDRVKCVDLHPSEPWLLAALYNGNVHIWNYENQQLVKSFEVSPVCNLPVRAAKFIPRKSWVVTGSDDMHVRIFNYNTLERVHQFEAHSDYLRQVVSLRLHIQNYFFEQKQSIVVHPTQPFVITSSDDMMIKLWDWDNKWQMKQSFEGHTFYVMQIAINPKDNNTFATASLDKTVKVWQFGSQQPNFTLEGHEKGVNCVDYYHGGDKPYLISGGDDHLVKIWDYQNKTCVQTLDGHAQNVSAVCFHPELPLIITGSEDSTVRLWHSSTYRLETTLNYGLERVWCIQAQRGSNTVAIGYDEGSVTLKLGREEPAVSMDQSGKILWARHSEIQQANLKTLDAEASEAIQDGERLPLSVKDLGACEIYPQTLAHSSNGRFVVACGDGEYIVYTAMALRNKDFGQALEFVWGTDPNMFAVRESATSVKIKKNFKEFKQIRTDVVMDGIDGGPLLAARSANSLCFYDWETAQMVRRIEIAAKHVYWSDSGEMVAICGDDSFYVLKYNPDAFANAAPEEITEDGVEDTFEVIGEQAECVKTGFWIGDCFVFTTSLNRLNYYVGGEIVTIAHMDRPLYLLGYMAKESRVYAVDKELNVVSYKLLLCVLEYQTAVMRRDFETADKVLATIPKEQRTRVAHFLEKQGFKRQALAVSQDPDHKFDLALALGDLKTAYDLALQGDSEEKWKMLSQAATLKSELMLAGECLGRARDYGGLLLLATCAGSAPLLNKLAADSATNGHHNVHFTTSLLLGDVDACIESLIATDRIPEAAFFARTHCPSQLQRIMGLWKEKADRVQKNTTRKIGESLADPGRYENLFPEWSTSQKAESYLRELSKLAVPASVRAPTNVQRNVMEELETAMSTGAVTFDEAGQAHLRGVARKATPVVNSTEPKQKFSPTPAATLAAAAVAAPIAAEVARKRTPSPPRREPSPELEQENGGQISDDDSDGLSREAVAPAAAPAEPDVVSERPRPDVVPRHGGPDLLPSAAPQRAPQPEVVVDAGEVRWSDDDFGDAEDGGNDINLDDLNLDDED
ncbi:WD domain, G-beta repeat protein [Ancylostoma caninum]|uniref:Beta'-coat protein n=1 Tax=Ancylostoma caninum TaxID=29170 RepID=A0A368H3R6_ANCCA|nr:WD domain, G-beta repeat protein [Ancylostoma caninum]